MTVHYHRALYKFSAKMAAKLEDNKHKRSWRVCSNDWLFKRLLEEAEELRLAILRGEDISGEAADVANFAMMLADNN